MFVVRARVLTMTDAETKRVNELRAAFKIVALWRDAEEKSRHFGEERNAVILAIAGAKAPRSERVQVFPGLCGVPVSFGDTGVCVSLTKEEIFAWLRRRGVFVSDDGAVRVDLRGLPQDLVQSLQSEFKR